MNLRRKLLTGYSILILLTLLTAFVSLHYLEKLNSINDSIARKNIPVMNATENMIECVYSQELYGNRFLIIKSEKMLELFSGSRDEFTKHLATLKGALDEKTGKIGSIESLHNEYGLLFQKLFDASRNAADAPIRQDKAILEKQNLLIAGLQEIHNLSSLEQNQKNITLSLIGMKAFRLIAVLCIISIIIGIAAAFLITHSISSPVDTLKKATQEISKGNFDHQIQIKNRDELGELAKSFQAMGKRLKNLEEMYRDANPLTRLPGGIAIDNILKKRIRLKAPLAFCLVDLDHFKIFNDYYGYARGNRVIKKTAEIVEEAIERFGSKNDFCGHIGGDDFVIITSPNSYEDICQYIIGTFDREIIGFYDGKDVTRGFIEAKSRSGKKRKFKIMTLSIAVVTNKLRKFKHHIEIAEIAAELKNFAKSFSRSLYIVDRRKNGSRKKGPEPTSGFSS